MNKEHSNSLLWIRQVADTGVAVEVIGNHSSDHKVKFSLVVKNAHGMLGCHRSSPTMGIFVKTCIL